MKNRLQCRPHFEYPAPTQNKEPGLGHLELGSLIHSVTLPALGPRHQVRRGEGRGCRAPQTPRVGQESPTHSVCSCSSPVLSVPHCLTPEAEKSLFPKLRNQEHPKRLFLCAQHSSWWPEKLRQGTPYIIHVSLSCTWLLGRLPLAHSFTQRGCSYHHPHLSACH